MQTRTIKAAALLTAGCLAFGGVAVAADWPGWRGPNGNGVSAERRLPTTWSETAHVRWKVPVGGAGVSAPVVWGEHVFLTASDGRHNTDLHVYSYRRSDGHVRWHTRLFGSAEPESEFAQGGMAVPTPVTDGRHLYALFGTGDLVCLDFEGKPVWIRSLAQEYGPFRNRWGMAASPLLVGDLLVVLVDHWGGSYLLGIGAQSGRTRWKKGRRATVSWSSPAGAVVGDKTQIVVAGSGYLWGYDAATGAERWKVGGLQMECIPSPVVQGGVVYAASGPRDATLAVRLDGRSGDLTRSNVAWRSRRGAPYVPSPVCYEGRCYLVDDQGIAACLDAATGAELWRQRVGGRYQASLVAGAGKVYYTNLDGVVTVARAGPRFQVLARNRLGEAIVASPAASHGQLFLRGETHLFCIE
jgi:outer membrane protein assembly factor BamB